MVSLEGVGINGGSLHSCVAFQTNLYKNVIDDVIRNMKEEYLNESMDTELLEELKQVGGG